MNTKCIYNVPGKLVPIKQDSRQCQTIPQALGKYPVRLLLFTLKLAKRICYTTPVTVTKPSSKAIED
ncbi:hypothetical protein C1H46_019964 [Malus baccata]|uniref:Uncharacterized protein n=1 Tax=Malus baccata TaxID=106549 RepID=A0A540M6N3_MALBA|nr:hypothetical protein C1H46_019964 [Malus baccata]